MNKIELYDTIINLNETSLNSIKQWNNINESYRLTKIRFMLENSNDKESLVKKAKETLTRIVNFFKELFKKIKKFFSDFIIKIISIFKKNNSELKKEKEEAKKGNVSGSENDNDDEEAKKGNVSGNENDNDDEEDIKLLSQNDKEGIKLLPQNTQTRPTRPKEVKVYAAISKAKLASCMSIEQAMQAFTTSCTDTFDYVEHGKIDVLEKRLKLINDALSSHSNNYRNAEIIASFKYKFDTQKILLNNLKKYKENYETSIEEVIKRINKINGKTDNLTELNEEVKNSQRYQKAIAMQQKLTAAMTKLVTKIISDTNAAVSKLRRLPKSAVKKENREFYYVEL